MKGRLTLWERINDYDFWNSLDKTTSKGMRRKYSNGSDEGFYSTLIGYWKLEALEGGWRLQLSKQWEKKIKENE